MQTVEPWSRCLRNALICRLLISACRLAFPKPVLRKRFKGYRQRHLAVHCKDCNVSVSWSRCSLSGDKPLCQGRVSQTPNIVPLACRGCGSLEWAFVQCPDLQTLDLSFAKCFPEPALQTLLKQTPNLKTLALPVCSSLGTSCPPPHKLFMTSPPWTSSPLSTQVLILHMYMNKV